MNDVKNSTRKIDTRRMVETAIMLALGFVLSMIKIKISPTGGSITLVSMLPIVLMAYRYGPAWGTLVGALHGALQMIEGGISTPPTKDFLSYLLVIFLDYILAWAAVGLLSGLIMKTIENPRGSITAGAAIGIFGRFLCSFLSGVIIWGVYAPENQSAALYSLIVNGTSLLPEMIATSIMAFVLFSFSSMRNLFAKPQHNSK